MSEASQESGAAVAVLRIESGSPTPEEIAALTVLFAAAAGGEEPSSSSGRDGGWSSRRRTFNPGAVRGAGWGRL